MTLATALTPALATAAPATTTAADDADAAAKRGSSGGVRELTYGDDEVLGEMMRSDHERIDFRPPGKHPSMIKVRAHFIPQLLRMATDI